VQPYINDGLRRLIINADDFGYTPGVNRAVAECARFGTVTSATLMANSVEFEDAVAIASEDVVAVGCHVVLVDGEPLSPAEKIPTLVEGTNFRASITDLARAAVTGAIAADEIAIEALAQFKKLRAAGVNITHFDSHKHAHMFPAVFRPLLAAAKANEIGAVRNPFEPFSLNWITSPGLWLRGAEMAALRSFRESFLKEVKSVGLKTTEGTFGVAVTGRLDLTWLKRIVQALPEGTWELVCHPGYDDASLRAANTRLREERDIEREALMSAEFKHLLAAEQIELIDYGDL
jgi:chitin disaccharide deacetylase